ncbi:MAG: glycosyltransferase family 4 protein, partial [Holophagales bacterium]|nr:glycosyltransferase family 4 protein [Holophagales bacterium]
FGGDGRDGLTAMKILIATVKVPFVSGGAEVQLEGMVKVLESRGHEVETLALPARIGPERVQVARTTVGSRLLGLGPRSHGFDRVIAMKYPAWLIRHPRKTLWVIHQERFAFELWHDGLSNIAEGDLTREAIAAADALAFSEAERIFAISANVARRLREVFDVEARVLRPPPLGGRRLRSSGSYEPFFFFPGRIAPLKRHGLVIEALALAEEPVRLVVAGREDLEGSWRKLEHLARSRGVEERIRWLGRCSDEALRDHYARARAVIFPPRDEDYGLVTPEAMLAERPVVTCTDSGGPLELIHHGEHGLVVPPEPEALAAALDALWRDEGLARRLGTAGRARYDSLEISWERVADELVGEPA